MTSTIADATAVCHHMPAIILKAAYIFSLIAAPARVPRA